MNKNISKKINLDEITFIRPILIFLLVAYHSFAPWCGTWDPFIGYDDNVVFWWIAKSTYSFMLPMFVFMSGYVWAYQREILGRKDDLKTLIEKKLQRLIIPCIFFSILYIPVEYNKYIHLDSVGEITYSLITIISGLGHLWFLPMLFWCFIFTWLLLSLSNQLLRWFVVLIALAFSIIAIPFQLGLTCYYILYFYLGYEIAGQRGKLKLYSNTRNCIILWGIFILTFIIISSFQKDYLIIANEDSIVKKIIVSYVSKLLTIVYSILGVAAVYMTAFNYSTNKSIPQWMFIIGGYCFGVYIVQQFILKIIY